MIRHSCDRGVVRGLPPAAECWLCHCIDLESHLERTLRLVLLFVAATLFSTCDPELLRRVERAMEAEGETIGRRRAAMAARAHVA